RILGFTRTMRHDGSIASLMSRFDRVERFRQRSDLVDLDENRVGNAHTNTVTETSGIGDDQVVTNELALVANKIGQVLPTFPVIFSHTIFDSDDRIVAGELGEILGLSLWIARLAFAFIDIITVLEEFGRSTVEAKSN